MSIIHHASSRGRHEYALKLPIAAGEVLQRLSYYDNVVGGLDIAIKAARHLGDLDGEADAVGNLGFVLVLLHDFSAAESAIRAAGDLYQRTGDVVGRAMVHHYLARLRVEQGRIAEGINLNTTALAQLRGQGAEGLEIIVLYRLGQAHRRARHLGLAASLCRDGLWLAEKLADERGQALCLTELAAVCIDSGDLMLAKGYCGRALPVHERLHDHDQAGKTYCLLSTIHRAEGEHDEAQRCARRATVSYRQARNATGELAAFDALGLSLRESGSIGEAAEAWTKALAIAEDIGDPLTSTLRTRLDNIGAVAQEAPTTPLGSPTRGQQSTKHG